jgi:O-antigen ligase
MSPIFWEDWPGYAKGFELTVLDALALSLYLSLPPASHSLPFRIAIGLYFVGILLSVIQATVPEAALFYFWQFARMCLLYAVVVRACANPIVPESLLKGMAAGLIIQVPIVLWQRFALGVLQATGTVSHQNELGMLSHFVAFPFFALLLAGRGGRLSGFVVAAGAIVELLTTSRATIALAAMGYVLVFGLSAIRGWTSRKSRILAIFVIAALIIAPLAISAIAQRGATEIQDSDSERVSLEKAASMMVTDHPLGVGANNFVLVANTEGYYRAAGVTWVNYTATVHNLYWLTLAENGYFGLLMFVIFLLGPFIVALQCGTRQPSDPRGDVIAGLCISLLAVYIQNFEEWVFITYRVQYVYVLSVGLIAGLATQMGYWRGEAPLHGLSATRL